MPNIKLLVKSKPSTIIPTEIITERIFFIRGQKVILDADLAEFYGVTTKSLNRAVRRNINRFPEDFTFQLTKEEDESLRYQIGTSNSSRGGRRYLPYAFTEHGVAMLSSVLKSPKAVGMSLLIVRTFIRIREILTSNKELNIKIEELQLEQKYQNKHINTIYSLIGKLIEKPKTIINQEIKPKGPLGFTR